MRVQNGLRTHLGAIDAAMQNPPSRAARSQKGRGKKRPADDAADTVLEGGMVHRAARKLPAQYRSARDGLVYAILLSHPDVAVLAAEGGAADATTNPATATEVDEPEGAILISLAPRLTDLFRRLYTDSALSAQWSPSAQVHAGDGGGSVPSLSYAGPSLSSGPGRGGNAAAAAGVGPGAPGASPPTARRPRRSDDEGQAGTAAEAAVVPDEQFGMEFGQFLHGAVRDILGVPAEDMLAGTEVRT